MSLQLAFDLEELRARSRDPSTSHLAAAAAKELQARHHTLILECLQKYGAAGKTGIAARSRLDHIAVARRLPELERVGLVRTTGRYVKSMSGRQEREWSIA